MRVPSCIAGISGNATLLANDKIVKEFGVTEEGREVSCSALVSPGDLITVSTSVDSGTDDFVDILIDGILRESKMNSRNARIHRHTFATVLHNPRKHPNDPRKLGKTGLKSYKMQVMTRETKNDIKIQETHGASSVSTIEVRFYRKNGLPNENGEGHVQKGPNFNDFPVWSDLNSKINQEQPNPAFEICFVNPVEGKNYSLQKKRVVEEQSAEYKLWASLKFILRSATDLLSMGFTHSSLTKKNITPTSRSAMNKDKSVLPETQRNQNAMNENASESSVSAVNQNKTILPETQRNQKHARSTKDKRDPKEGVPQLSVPELDLQDLPTVESIEQDQLCKNKSRSKHSNENPGATDQLVKKGVNSGLSSPPTYQSWRARSPTTSSGSQSSPEISTDVSENQKFQAIVPNEPDVDGKITTVDPELTPLYSSKKPVSLREDSVPISSVSMLRIEGTPGPIANGESQPPQGTKEPVSYSQATTASQTSSQEAEAVLALALTMLSRKGEKRKADMISQDHSTLTSPVLGPRKIQTSSAMRSGLHAENEKTQSLGLGIGLRNSPSSQETDIHAPLTDSKKSQTLAAELYNSLEQDKLDTLSQAEREKAVANKRYSDAICERNRLKKEHEDALLLCNERAEIRELNIEAQKLEAECDDLKAKIATLRGTPL